MKEVAKYSGCFVCGEDNEIGLKAKFYHKDGKAITEYIANKRFEGYKDVFHGGILSTLLDEVMIKALIGLEIFTMTVEMTIKFHKIVKIGEKLLFEGEIDHQKSRMVYTKGVAKNEKGEIVATATGKYLKVNDKLKAELNKSLEDV
ncbi:MAG: PaaI family thioesterase [candidate division Zixibacteria bacterium]|nr:PaaI family thioesterase [candidate division Zixibacteria bacterium]